MTISIAISLVSIGLSLVLFWRTELRRARMSLRLLAPPDSWMVMMARRGRSKWQAADPAEAEVVLFHGAFVGSVANDGPRGGAIWGLVGELIGLDGGWGLRNFNASVATPYALGGRECVGLSQIAFTMECDFERLGEGLRALSAAREVVFLVTYMREDLWGRARRHETSLRVPCSQLLSALKEGSAGIDLVTCQIVPAARELARNVFLPFDLTPPEVETLSTWALKVEQPTYLVVPDGTEDRFKLLIQRPHSNVPDQGSSVVANGTEDSLSRIAHAQRLLAAEIDDLRSGAVRI